MAAAWLQCEAMKGVQESNVGVMGSGYLHTGTKTFGCLNLQTLAFLSSI